LHEDFEQEIEEVLVPVVVAKLCFVEVERKPAGGYVRVTMRPVAHR
jgi:hypothetical protein